MKNDMAGNCQSLFLFKTMFLKTNFNFIILFKLIITTLQLVLVLNFSSSWPKTAIVVFTATATEILTSYAMREIHNIKTYKKREESLQSH